MVGQRLVTSNYVNASGIDFMICFITMWLTWRLHCTYTRPQEVGRTIYARLDSLHATPHRKIGPWEIDSEDFSRREKNTMNEVDVGFILVFIFSYFTIILDSF